MKNEEKLNKETEDYKQKCEEYLNGWKRERADFLNYKKEEMERISELIKYANAELVLRILPILDNFEVAEKKIPENSKNDESVKGLLQINQQLKDFLKSQGIEEIKALGEKFDPNFHEVIGEVARGPSSDGTSSAGIAVGIVIEEAQKGYTMHKKVIRPAKVKVTK